MLQDDALSAVIPAWTLNEPCFLIRFKGHSDLERQIPQSLMPAAKLFGQMFARG